MKYKGKITLQLLSAIVLLLLGGYIGYFLRQFTHREHYSRLEGNMIACSNNLRQLWRAKQLYATASGAQPGDSVRAANLDEYIWKGCAGCTNCPSGGVIAIGTIGENPGCSVKEHQEAFLGMLEYDKRKWKPNKPSQDSVVPPHPER